MWARGYCGDLFQSILCAILCSWSWFVFVSTTGSLAGWEDQCGAGRQRVIMQSSLCLCSFFSPKTCTSSFDHSFQIQPTNIKYLHKLDKEGRKTTHTHRNRHCVLWEEYCFIFSLLLCPVPQRVHRYRLTAVVSLCSGDFMHLWLCRKRCKEGYFFKINRIHFLP